MTRTLPKGDADAHDFIQFRGPQTSVTHDGTGVRFELEHRHGVMAHQAVPVVDADADPEDTPDDAIVRPVAEQLVESNPLICWGVACERCGDVFDSLKAENSHQSVHQEDADGSGTGDGDG